MHQKIIGTVVTYDIQSNQKDNNIARNALINLLYDLGYKDGDDQSTKIHSQIIPDSTIEDINYLCHAPHINFQQGDKISVYYPYQGCLDPLPSIIKCRYVYNRIINQFI